MSDDQEAVYIFLSIQHWFFNIKKNSSANKVAFWVWQLLHLLNEYKWNGPNSMCLEMSKMLCVLGLHSWWLLVHLFFQHAIHFFVIKIVSYFRQKDMLKIWYARTFIQCAYNGIYPAPIYGICIKDPSAWITHTIRIMCYQSAKQAITICLRHANLLA